jgi:hypothetical protein
MPELLHIAAFQKFFSATPSHLEAVVAFGLFMESEQKWADLQSTPPDEETYKTYHGIYLTPHEIQGYLETAKALLAEFGDDMIREAEPKLLQSNLDAFLQAARGGDRKFRWAGVWEALVGALFWTVLLILAAVLTHRANIDLIEIYKKVSGAHE